MKRLQYFYTTNPGIVLFTCTVAVVAGLSVLYNYAPTGFIALFVLYKLDRQLAQNRTLRSYFLLSAVFFCTLFVTTTWWFLKITATGWNTYIWIFPPWVWLAAVLVVCCFLASMAASLPKLGYAVLARRYQLHPAVLVLTWSLCYMLAEIILSTGISALTRGNGVPLYPSWNFSSTALLIRPESILGSVLSYSGFWGSAFVIFFSTASLSAVFGSRPQKNWWRVAISGGGLILLMVLNVISAPSHVAHNSNTVLAVGVSSADGTNRYLDAVQATALPDNQEVVLVLPEYSNLLRPFGSGVLGSTSNDDYRDRLKDVFRGKSVRIVGSEDEFRGGKRHAESYVLDSNLEKLVVRAKTFLVPGGEYMTPWVGALMEQLDSRSIEAFYTERGRFVSSEFNTNASSSIGVGACSMVLIPFSYQEQVVNGATLLTSNVSFAQFTNAPEYQDYSLRFSKFIARSLERPFVSSASFGPTFVLDTNGQLVASKDEGLLSTQVLTNNKKTLYAQWGDTKIVAILLAGSTLIIVAMLVHTKPTLTKQAATNKNSL